jgi:hypothetical protein
LSTDERRQAVQRLGYTERQARFLVTVMLHAGVCIGRQFCQFARIPYGRTMHTFFERLVARGDATAHRCGHNRARVYHIHAKRLYRAVGQPDNRRRRPVTVGRAVERLMLLDAVLADWDNTWLATEDEKLAHFTLSHRIQRAYLPSLTFRAGEAETVRYFPDKLPIRVDPDGRCVFVYVLTRDLPIDFRAFLERHAELWRRLPSWTVRLLVPRHHTDLVSRYHAAFREQLASPLDPNLVEEFRWYAHARARGTRDVEERFDLAARAFGAPRFQAVYRAWRERGEMVIDALSSHSLKDQLEWETGRWEREVLPHNYLRLLPLVGTA